MEVSTQALHARDSGSILELGMGLRCENMVLNCRAVYIFTPDSNNLTVLLTDTFRFYKGMGNMVTVVVVYKICSIL